MMENLTGLHDRHQSNEIRYFDSLLKGRINSFVQKQICALLKPLDSKLIIKIETVQQQTNCVDCGIFAIAFVVSA